LYELKSFISKLNNIVKIFNDDIINLKTLKLVDKKLNSQIENPLKDYKSKEITKSKKRFYKGVLWTKNKNIVMEFLKLYYHGTKEQKKEVSDYLGYQTWDSMKTFKGEIMERFKITPKEVGITHFPNIHNLNLNKLPNFKWKFDINKWKTN
jgi:hypothetical protein